MTGRIGDYSQARAGMVWEHETAMNTTRTTLRQALWRWQRGFARALLLLGALAGMTFGSVAYGQITPRLPGPATTASQTSTGIQFRAAAASSTIKFRAATSAAVDSGVLALTLTKPPG